MGNETEESHAMRSKTWGNAVGKRERSNSVPSGYGQASAGTSQESFQDPLKETPIVLPLVQPTIPAIFIDGNPYDFSRTGSIGSLCPESSVFSVSETVDRDWRDCELGSTDGDGRRDSYFGQSLGVFDSNDEDDRRDSFSSAHSLSVIGSNDDERPGSPCSVQSLCVYGSAEGRQRRGSIRSAQSLCVLGNNEDDDRRISLGSTQSLCVLGTNDRVERRSSLSRGRSLSPSGRTLSVSFGDVTVCGLEGAAPEPGVSGAKIGATIGASTSLPNLESLDDLLSPDFNDIILAAATPILGPDSSRGRHRSLGQWLSNKSRHMSQSTSSLTSRSSTQSAGDTSSLPRSVGARQSMKAALTQMRRHRLVPGDFHPRVLRPSTSLGAFGDWKDVENPTLTVSFAFLKNILCLQQLLS